jgi:hypothetical protein
MSPTRGPNRGPPISRPAIPLTAMAAAPMMQHQIRSAKKLLKPTAMGTATSQTKSGGNSALWSTTWWDVNGSGLMNPCPSTSSLAVVW